MTTEIEKQNLEAHVELCAERYKSLESKLNTLETKVERLEEHIIFIRDKLSELQTRQTKQLLQLAQQ